MGKSSESAARPSAPKPAEELTLTEFCRRISETVRRPELISAFESAQRRAGQVKASQDVYRQRFDAFIHSPV